MSIERDSLVRDLRMETLIHPRIVPPNKTCSSKQSLPIPQGPQEHGMQLTSIPGAQEFFFPGLEVSVCHKFLTFRRTCPGAGEI